MLSLSDTQLQVMQEALCAFRCEVRMGEVLRLRRLVLAEQERRQDSPESYIEMERRTR